MIEESDQRVTVVFYFGTYSLYGKGEGLKDSILNVAHGNPVLIHQNRKNGESSAFFSDNRYGQTGADPAGSVLDL